jgi:hypothetical protein
MWWIAGPEGEELKLRMWLGLVVAGALMLLLIACGGKDSGSLGPREACNEMVDHFEECGLDPSAAARDALCLEAVGATVDDGGACDDAMIQRFECFSDLSCDVLNGGSPACIDEKEAVFDNCDDPFKI